MRWLLLAEARAPSPQVGLVLSESPLITHGFHGFQMPSTDGPKRAFLLASPGHISPTWFPEGSLRREGVGAARIPVWLLPFPTSRQSWELPAMVENNREPRSALTLAVLLAPL